MSTYLSLANTPKSEITSEQIEELLELTNKDERVKFIKQDAGSMTPSFNIKADELDDGVYTLGAIANHLSIMPSERRRKIESEKLPDVINVSNFMDYGERSESDIRHLPRFTRTKMAEFMNSLKPSYAKAQCINILSYKLKGNESIADRFERDHDSIHDARRHAQMLVKAGCANQVDQSKYHLGKIVFEDGSSL
jgi:hypothetical protein